VNVPDALRREWHWECAEELLSRLPSAPRQANKPMLLDGTPVRFPGCPGCGAAPVSVNAEDHFVDRAERFWHWGCAQRRLSECGHEDAVSVSRH